MQFKSPGTGTERGGLDLSVQSVQSAHWFLLLAFYTIPLVFMLVLYVLNSELNLQKRLQNELSLDNCYGNHFKPCKEAGRGWKAFILAVVVALLKYCVFLSFYSEGLRHFLKYFGTTHVL